MAGMAIRVRKTNAIVGGGIILGFIFMLYLVVDTLNIPYEEQELQKVSQSVSQSGRQVEQLQLLFLLYIGNACTTCPF